jgi:hypothetical protein
MPRKTDFVRSQLRERTEPIQVFLDLVGPMCVITRVKAVGQLAAVLLAFWFPGGAVAQTGTSSDAASSFFQRQGLLLNRPQPSNTVVIPPARAANRPDPARQEKFDRLMINGVIYTNVLLRTINASEGALHHDGGLEKIRLGDLPEAIRVRFCDPASLRLVGGHVVSTDGWPRLSGKITNVLTNGVLVKLEVPKAGAVAFVACDPAAEALQDGQPLSLCAQEAGSAEVGGKTVPAFDAGLRYKAP